MLAVVQFLRLRRLKRLALRLNLALKLDHYMTLIAFVISIALVVHVTWAISHEGLDQHIEQVPAKQRAKTVRVKALLTISKAIILISTAVFDSERSPLELGEHPDPAFRFTFSSQNLQTSTPSHRDVLIDDGCCTSRVGRANGQPSDLSSCDSCVGQLDQWPMW